MSCKWLKEHKKGIWNPESLEYTGRERGSGGVGEEKREYGGKIRHQVT